MVPKKTRNDYLRDWRRRNPDKVRAANRRSRERRPQAHATAEKNWRKNNPDKVRAYDLKQNQDKREFIREVVGTLCVDCAESRLESLEYHHPGNRDTPHGLIRLSWPQLKEEVMHLITLCGTCHNLRHRRNNVGP